MDEKQRNVENVNSIVSTAFECAATKDIGCIVYIFDKSEDGDGTGFNTKNCDTGDALVAISRIIKQFGINRDALLEAIM